MTVGMIYRGKDYTQEETEALRKIQRERGVSLDEAIQEWHAAKELRRGYAERATGASA